MQHVHRTQHMSSRHHVYIMCVMCIVCVGCQPPMHPTEAPVAPGVASLAREPHRASCHLKYTTPLASLQVQAEIIARWPDFSDATVDKDPLLLNPDL